MAFSGCRTAPETVTSLSVRFDWQPTWPREVAADAARFEGMAAALTEGQRNELIELTRGLATQSRTPWRNVGHAY